MIGNAVYDILSKDTDIISILGGNRIYPLIIPLDQDIPAIIYFINSVTAIDNKCSTVLNDVITVEIICIDRDYAQLQELIKAVRLSLHHKHYIFNNIRIKDTRFKSSSDNYENTTDTFIHKMTFDFYTVVS